LNNGLEDAGKLVGELKDVTGMEGIREAVRRYEEEMIGRTNKEYEISMKSTELSHDWSMIVSFHAFVLRYRVLTIA
jgi:2-polyprenyl-6-methoxyphenol hydroxylase-like FAD-dependent oxidoreductase